ncbi:uncharacterized protein LOC143914434 [Arctopsyche grandis]|uniref:uncharacterized protein LOC143914434 n=1 Tax=Arctopsyche grandis TaxID=121162 RepID=UPI00406D64B4
MESKYERRTRLAKAKLKRQLKLANEDEESKQKRKLYQARISREYYQRKLKSSDSFKSPKERCCIRKVTGQNEFESEIHTVCDKTCWKPPKQLTVEEREKKLAYNREYYYKIRRVTKPRVNVEQTTSCTSEKLLDNNKTSESNSNLPKKLRGPPRQMTKEEHEKRLAFKRAYYYKTRRTDKPRVIVEQNKSITCTSETTIEEREKKLAQYREYYYRTRSVKKPGINVEQTSSCTSKSKKLPKQLSIEEREKKLAYRREYYYKTRRVKNPRTNVEQYMSTACINEELPDNNKTSETKPNLPKRHHWKQITIEEKERRMAWQREYYTRKVKNAKKPPKQLTIEERENKLAIQREYYYRTRSVKKPRINVEQTSSCTSKSKQRPKQLTIEEREKKRAYLREYYYKTRKAKKPRINVEQTTSCTSEKPPKQLTVEEREKKLAYNREYYYKIRRVTKPRVNVEQTTSCTSEKLLDNNKTSETNSNLPKKLRGPPRQMTKEEHEKRLAFKRAYYYKTRRTDKPRVIVEQNKSITCTSEELPDNNNTPETKPKLPKQYHWQQITIEQKERRLANARQYKKIILANKINGESIEEREKRLIIGRKYYYKTRKAKKPRINVEQTTSCTSEKSTDNNQTSETNPNLPKPVPGPPKHRIIEQQQRRLDPQREYYYKARKEKEPRFNVERNKSTACEVNEKEEMKHIHNTVESEETSISGENTTSDQQLILDKIKNCNTSKTSLVESNKNHETKQIEPKKIYVRVIVKKTTSSKEGEHKAKQNDHHKKQKDTLEQPLIWVGNSKYTQVTNINNIQRILPGPFSVKEGSNKCHVVFTNEISEFSDDMRILILAISSMPKNQQVLALNLIFKTIKNGICDKLLENTAVGTITWAIPINFVPNI